MYPNCHEYFFYDRHYPRKFWCLLYILNDCVKHSKKKKKSQENILAHLIGELYLSRNLDNIEQSAKVTL